MGNDEWTPARGWAIGLGKAAWKSAVGGAIVGGAGYLLITFAMHAGGNTIYGAFLFGAIAGFSLGWFVSRNLAEDCGLLGSVIGGPALAMLLAAELLGSWAAWSILGVTGVGPWGFTVIVMIMSLIGAGMMFISDS